MLFSIKECGSIILFKYFFIICIDFKNFYFGKKIKKNKNNNTTYYSYFVIKK